MNSEIVFRVLMLLAFLAMMAIRVYYQSKVLREERKIDVREGKWSILAGSIAALTSLVFGAEYLLSPGLFSFAYLVRYPLWLRWLGAALLAAGITLLGLAHHHLAESFHSLVVSKQDQVLVTSGPYRWIRHPIYTAYLMNYLGGGLLAGNIVLTIVPVAMDALLVGMRMGQEEEMLRQQFGADYVEYEG